MTEATSAISSHLRYIAGRPVLVILALSVVLFSVTSFFSGPDSNVGDLHKQGLQALSNTRKPQHTGRKPRYVFVDLGANRADSLEVFLKEPHAKWHEDFPKPDWATYDQAGT